MTNPEKNLVTVDAPLSALSTLANRFGVESNAVFLKSLKDVAFRSPNVTTEQLMALVVVANQYQLNPFTRELYAFPEKGGGIVPIVSVDGWYRILNEQPEFDGIEYGEETDPTEGVCGVASIYRKDRSHAIIVREYLAEVKRNTDPWKQYPHRMLRHKTIIQAIRLAFGFAGIYEPDEAERIIQSERVVRVEDGARGAKRVAQLLNVGEPAPTLPEEPDQAPHGEDLPL